MKIPIIADTTHALAKAFGCLKADEGIAYRGLYIIDNKGKIKKNVQIILQKGPIQDSKEKIAYAVRPLMYFDSPTLFPPKLYFDLKFTSTFLSQVYLGLQFDLFFIAILRTILELNYLNLYGKTLLRPTIYFDFSVTTLLPP